MQQIENRLMTNDLIHRRGKEKYKVDSKHDIKTFTEDALARITSNYSILIGKGPSGEVYRGIFGYEPVAVKRYYIHKISRQEFTDEVISIHSQMSHKNLIKLIGYCIGESTLVMVTEYISGGNLENILHGSDTSIPLDVRLGIAIGCAEALSYMHSMNLSSHSAIKPTNILLDENLTAKVSDIGVSRFLLGGITQYTIFVKGSTDYLDPICIEEGCLTPESDVYSFGAVLLEVISRRRVRQGDINLIATFRKACAKGKGLKELFDKTIACQKTMKILKEVVKLAMECLALDINARPQMGDVAKRLRVLKKVLKDDRQEKSTESILATHNSWRNNSKKDISVPDFDSMAQIKKSFGFFKRNTSNSKILSEPNTLRIFTKTELNDITHNYSNLLNGGTSAMVYKGTLEDNTVVAVRKFFELLEDFREAFINGGIILSQIIHKNIIKLLGYCLEDDNPIFVYEYAAKGSLSDVLDGQEDFPLHLRMKVAIQIAEALEYLHSSATGTIKHGYIVPSKIFIDGNFMPKLAGFSWARRLIRDSKITASDNAVCSSLPESGLCNDPFAADQSANLKVKSDVYQYGVLLLTLISRKNFIFYADHLDLIVQFTSAYEADSSGRAFFDENISTDENIKILEDIGKLALKCISPEVQERPTMKEVAQHLRRIERSSKGTQVSEIEAYICGYQATAEGAEPDALLSSEIVNSQ